ncbi:periodic tryptophan protein 1 homolog [Amphiura filiformis]|uniref:periodic tryptophan protein 1 homolog n=1 Tax=Amphiura filiformis TaxID=82378 RepID=UPI003B20D4EE
MSGSSQVTCLAWVKRGAAKETPDKVELSQEQLKKLFQEAKTGLQEVGEAEDESGEVDTNEDEDGSDDGDTEAKEGDDDAARGEGEHITPAAEEEEDELAKYGLDKYDDDEGGEPMEEGQASGGGGMIASTLPSLAMYASNDDDPYITLKDDEEDEFEREDFTIKPTDNLVVLGKVHEDYGNIEVHVYNEAEGALYIHHDILLPAFPLALEWLNFDPGEGTPGNLVAVGSMMPTIDVWDLDLVDCLEPAFTLGTPKSKLRKKSANIIAHHDAVLDLSWNRLVPHALASASADRTIVLWDMEECKAVSDIRKHTDKVQSLQWHPFEAQSLLSGGFDKTVKVYDCRSPGDNLQSWAIDGEVERVLWNHFQPFTFLASTDTGFVCCYDVRSASDPVFRLKAHDDAITGLSLSSQVSGCLVTGSADNTYKVWDIQDNKPSLVVSKDPKMKAIHCVHGNPDSAFVMAMGGERDGLRAVDIMSHAPVSNQFRDRPKHRIPEPDVTSSNEGLVRTQPGTSGNNAAPSTSSAQKSRRKRKKKKNVKSS